VVTRTRWLVVGLAVSLATALTAIGLIVWIAVDPEYWFPGTPFVTRSLATQERSKTSTYQRADGHVELPTRSDELSLALDRQRAFALHLVGSVTRGS
jgi:hypothetical protein